MKEYNLLEEVVDGCDYTGMLKDKACEVYSLRYQEAVWLIRQGRLNDVLPIEYAVSFMRDYIWFGDENR